jgi:hypothetical protein
MFITIISNKSSRTAVVVRSKTNGDQLNNIGHEASSSFRNKNQEYLKDKLNELATYSKNKNITDLYRGINELKKNYHPKTYLVKKGNGDLFADSQSILNRPKNYYSKILCVHRVTYVSRRKSLQLTHQYHCLALLRLNLRTLLQGGKL